MRGRVAVGPTAEAQRINRCVGVLGRHIRCRHAECRLLTVNGIESCAQCRVDGVIAAAAFIAVVAEAPAARADQRAHARAARDTAGIERGPTAAAYGEGGVATEHHVAAGGGARAGVFARIEHQR